MRINEICLLTNKTKDDYDTGKATDYDYSARKCGGYAGTGRGKDLREIIVDIFPEEENRVCLEDGKPKYALGG